MTLSIRTSNGIDELRCMLYAKPSEIKTTYNFGEKECILIYGLFEQMKAGDSFRHETTTRGNRVYNVL